MTSVTTVDATASKQVVTSSKAPDLRASLTVNIKASEATSARTTLNEWRGGHGPIIVVPRPYPRPYPRPWPRHHHGPIIVVPLPIPSVGFHICAPGEEYSAREVRRDVYGNYWCSDY